MMKITVKWLLAAIVALAVGYPSVQAYAQGDRYYETAEIEQDLAPVALYPDELLAQILMAATYPLEVVDADRWVRTSGNARLRGERLAEALDSQDWDPSVKALVPFPQILRLLNSRPDWMNRLGEEFLSQPDEVTDAVQRLRARASAAGNLRSGPQLIVRNEGPSIIIEPAQPDFVYVPYYDPRSAYGSWEYADYPPVYFPPPRGYSPRLSIGGLFFLGAIPIVPSLWGWNDWDWSGRRITVRRDRYERLNYNRAPRFTGNVWEHDSYHRRGATYRAPEIRQRFDRGDFGQRDVNRDRSQDRRYNNAARQFEQRAQQQERARETIRNRVQNRQGGSDRQQPNRALDNINRGPNDERQRNQRDQQLQRDQNRQQEQRNQQDQRNQREGDRNDQRQQQLQQREQQRGQQQQRVQEQQQRREQQQQERAQQQQQRQQEQGQQRAQQQQKQQEQQQERAQQQQQRQQELQQRRGEQTQQRQQQQQERAQQQRGQQQQERAQQQQQQRSQQQQERAQQQQQQRGQQQQERAQQQQQKRDERPAADENRNR